MTAADCGLPWVPGAGEGGGGVFENICSNVLQVNNLIGGEERYASWEHQCSRVKDPLDFCDSQSSQQK